MWYLARGSGLVSLLLLSGSVVLGIVTTARWSSERWPRFTVNFVHRNVTLLALVFIGVHVATIVLDGVLRWQARMAIATTTRHFADSRP